MDNIERLTFGDFARLKDHIYFFAVGVERNRERLAYIPHKEMGDIALIYTIRSPLENGRERWTSVNNAMLQAFGISQKRLHDVALENSLRDYPAHFISMGQILQSMLGISSDSMNENAVMYVLTNRERHLGAAVVFYPEILQELQKYFPQGYYVLPSSIHECLIVPKNNSVVMDGAEFSDMVRAVNADMVTSEEQLSDYAHEYDAKTHTLVLPESIREKMIKPAREDRNNQTR